MRRSLVPNHRAQQRHDYAGGNQEVGCDVAQFGHGRIVAECKQRMLDLANQQRDAKNQKRPRGRG